MIKKIKNWYNDNKKDYGKSYADYELSENIFLLIIILIIIALIVFMVNIIISARGDIEGRIIDGKYHTNVTFIEGMFMYEINIQVDDQTFEYVIIDDDFRLSDSLTNNHIIKLKDDSITKIIDTINYETLSLDHRKVASISRNGEYIGTDLNDVRVFDGCYIEIIIE